MYQQDKNTYVKLWRSTLVNQFLMSDNNAFDVFMKLLMIVDRKTGSFVTGRYALAELCNMKPSTVRDVLVRLENEHMIKVNHDYSKSKIIICNWANYQEQPVTSPSPARHQPVTTTTLNKNKKENIYTGIGLKKYRTVEEMGMPKLGGSI